MITKKKINKQFKSICILLGVLFIISAIIAYIIPVDNSNEQQIRLLKTNFKLNKVVINELENKTKLQAAIMVKNEELLNNQKLIIEEMDKIIITLELKLKQTTDKYHLCIDDKDLFEEGD